MVGGVQDGPRRGEKDAGTGPTRARESRLGSRDRRRRWSSVVVGRVLLEVMLLFVLLWLLVELAFVLLPVLVVELLKAFLFVVFVFGVVVVVVGVVLIVVEVVVVVPLAIACWSIRGRRGRWG